MINELEIALVDRFRGIGADPPRSHQLEIDAAGVRTFAAHIDASMSATVIIRSNGFVGERERPNRS